MITGGANIHGHHTSERIELYFVLWLGTLYIKMLGSMMTIITVSYTHLDVYKRQLPW